MPITLHASGPQITKLLDGAGLLGPDVQFVHPTGMSAEDHAILKAKGVSYSMSPIGESRRPGNAGVIFYTDIGIPIIGFALLWLQHRLARKPSAPDAVPGDAGTPRDSGANAEPDVAPDRGGSGDGNFTTARRRGR